jgi:stage II sporulation protein D
MVAEPPGRVRTRRPGPRSGSALASLLLALLVPSTVGRPASAGEPSPDPGGREPLIRVGVRVGVGSATVAAPGGLALSDAQTGRALGRVEGGKDLEVRRDGGALGIAGDGLETSGPVFALRVDPEGTVTVDGEPYRGRLELIAVEDSGVSVVNVLPIEEYLLGVVPLEIGPRGPAEIAAVEAQAVAARTYAIAHLGGHEEMGFDVFATVEDQVYGGVAVERDEATAAVRSTSGRILTSDGLPIRAYYHSTCGGRTAPVEEVMDRPGAPYLRSVADTAPDGSAWCAISPRFRWTETWFPEELNGRVRDELARMFGTEPGRIGPLERVRITERTGGGRVRAVSFAGPRAELAVERLDIRFALRDAAGRILGSTDFEIAPRADGALELHGRGYGHGAGMCQWGAIARARAGQTYGEILAAYYPGAELTRVY